MWVDYTINHRVRVKLTDRGRAALRQQHSDHWRVRTIRGESIPPYNQPEQDADGWSVWQLWELVAKLGPGCMRTSLPFCTAMQVEVLDPQREKSNG